jgi:hypothetical protein
MDAVWDVLRWGGLVVGIVLCIVHVLFSLLFLSLIFYEKAQLWQRGMCLSLSLGCLYLPIYGIGTLIFGFSDPLSSYHAMLYEHNIAWLWAAVAIAIFILSIVIGGLQELQDVFERRRQQRAAEVSALMQLAGKPSEVIMGDMYKNIQGSTIITRSLLVNSLNKINEQDSDIAKALSTVGQAIHDSGNREAGELFDQFNEELSKDKPQKSILKTCWAGIQQALPTIKSIAEATGVVAKLF